MMRAYEMRNHCERRKSRMALEKAFLLFWLFGTVIPSEDCFACAAMRGGLDDPVSMKIEGSSSMRFMVSGAVADIHRCYPSFILL